MSREEKGGFTAEPFGPEAAEAAEREARTRALESNAPRLSAFLGEALELMGRRADGRAKPIPTPWPAVNDATGGGLWPGLHVLTGATGDGKTQWALQVALKAAQAGTPTLYIGLELGRVDLVARLLALMMADENPRSAPKWSELYLGKNRAAIMAAHDKYAPKLDALPLRLEVGGPFGWSVDRLAERAQALRDANPEPDGPGSCPMLIVLDYLQVVASPQGDRQELRERIGQAAYAGRTIARDLGAAVLMLSSVSREALRGLSEYRSKGELGDMEKLNPAELVGLGKESGEIEYAADTVLALCRGERQAHDMHLAVAKVRAGVQSWQRLTFNGGWFEQMKEQPTY